MKRKSNPVAVLHIAVNAVVGPQLRGLITVNNFRLLSSMQKSTYYYKYVIMTVLIWYNCHVGRLQDKCRINEADGYAFHPN